MNLRSVDGPCAYDEGQTSLYVSPRSYTTAPSFMGNMGALLQVGVQELGESEDDGLLTPRDGGDIVLTEIFEEARASERSLGHAPS